MSTPREIVVSVRLDHGSVYVLDLLVESGVARSRSEATAHLVQIGISASGHLLKAVREIANRARLLREEFSSAAEGGTKTAIEAGAGGHVAGSDGITAVGGDAAEGAGQGGEDDGKAAVRIDAVAAGGARADAAGNVRDDGAGGVLDDGAGGVRADAAVGVRDDAADGVRDDARGSTGRGVADGPTGRAYIGRGSGGRGSGMWGTWAVGPGIGDLEASDEDLLRLYEKAIEKARAYSGDEIDVFRAATFSEPMRLEAMIRENSELMRRFDENGWTPLHLAALFERPRTVTALVTAGADPSVKSANELAATPLHAAVYGRSSYAADALLLFKADVNARQANGWTPLHLAAHVGDEPMVGLLLRYGADPSIRSLSGETPFDIAMKHGHARMAQRLSGLRKRFR